MYTPRFAISIINTATGNGIIDCGTSDLKTAKGAATNWIRNCGHVLGFFLAAESKSAGSGLNFIEVVMRPIETKEDAINMSVSHILGLAYIARERRNGATVINLNDIDTGCRGWLEARANG